MVPRLTGRRVALLIEEGFSSREVQEPLRVLAAEGAEVVVVAPSTKAPYRDRTGSDTVTASLAAGAARMAQFDALIIPGGHAPDRMRLRHAMVDLVTEAMASGKTVAAICHGPQVLITANVVRDRTLTCWPSIAVDVKNAGGRYVDRPSVRDGNLITARKSDDLPAFLEMLIDLLSAAPAAADRAPRA
jgi:protease I